MSKYLNEESVIEWLGDVGQTDATMIVSAVMALAEQQRIANLIAYLQISVRDAQDGGHLYVGIVEAARIMSVAAEALDLA